MSRQDIQKRENVKKNRVFELIAYFLGIVIVSLSITAMILTGGNLNDFCYNGKSSEINKTYTNNYSCSGMVYLEENSTMEVTDAEALTVMILPTAGDVYLFLNLQINIWEEDTLQTRLIYYNEMGSVLYESTQDILLKNGQQYIALSDMNSDVARIGLSLKNQVGKRFWIESAVLQEEIQDWTILEFGCMTLGWTIVCSLAVYMICRWRRKRNVCLSKNFLHGARELMEKLISKINVPVVESNVQAGVLRTVLFAIMFFVLQYLDMEEKCVGHSASTLRFVVCSVILLLISVISLERKRYRKKGREMFLKLWVIQGLICICSEFVVEKRFWGRGIFMLLIMGCFVYVWSCMKRPERMLLDFSRGLEVMFWLNTGYCVLFKPCDQMSRYTGFSDNPNIFMMYLLPELVVVLMGVYRNWREQRYGHLFIRSIGMGIGVLYLYKTECRTGLIGAGLAAIVILSSVIWQWKSINSIQKGMFFVSILSAVVGMLLVNTISFSVEVQALERFVQGLQYGEGLNRFSSGRISIYKTYIEQMNLWGHSFRETINDIQYDAHNGILTMGYLYGIIIIMPYLTWLICYLKYAIAYWKENILKSSFSIMPILVFCSMLPVVLFENLEQFLRWPVWLLYYIISGMLLWEEKGDESQ